MNTPTWTQYPVTFSPVHITAAQSGACYALGAGGDIHFYDGSSWTPISSPTADPFVSISASTDGSLVGVAANPITNSFTTHLYAYGGWTTIAAASTGSILNIAAGDVSSYVYHDTFGSITKFTNGTTSTLSTSGGPTKLSSTLGVANVWGIDGSGNVYQRNSPSWSPVTGKTLKQVDVSLSSSATLQVCGVDASGNGWMLNGATWTAISKPVFGAKFTSLEAGAGVIWATLSNGSVYNGTF